MAQAHPKYVYLLALSYFLQIEELYRQFDDMPPWVILKLRHMWLGQAHTSTITANENINFFIIYFDAIKTISQGIMSASTSSSPLSAQARFAKIPFTVCKNTLKRPPAS
ncbi:MULTISPECIES: hypothetical protein [unclassified Bartonella]|uniref:hypothetical protein n=1 Tax=unclassified Bartonella TaxID=2645622 RepID=UPI0035D07164